jgi:hypothetical protein
MTHHELYIEENETPESFISKLNALGLKFKEERVIVDLEKPNMKGETIKILHDKWTNELVGYVLQAPPDE